MFFFKEYESLDFKHRCVEKAYLAILNDDLETAGAIFESIDSPRARWGKCLVQILNGFLEDCPSYFEIRNFLEIDLEFLYKNEKIEYIELIFGALEYLVDINQEVYKYVARVMFECHLYKVAKEFLDKSKKVFYKDPELHFMLAKFYIQTFEYSNAYHHVNECLNIIPDYYPAKILKEEIVKHLA